jgi:hypothetical protein
MITPAAGLATLASAATLAMFLLAQAHGPSLSLTGLAVAAMTAFTSMFTWAVRACQPQPPISEDAAYEMGLRHGRASIRR